MRKTKSTKIKTVNVMGHRLRASALMKALISEHVAAVQTSDHSTACLIEEFIHNYANRHKKYDTVRVSKSEDV